MKESVIQSACYAVANWKYKVNYADILASGLGGIFMYFPLAFSDLIYIMFWIAEHVLCLVLVIL